jgi:hypothetical protein
MQCPLCNHSEPVLFHRDKKREYHRCQSCQLVFVPESYFLSPELEKAEYDKHENALDDEGYLKFLSRMIDPIMERVPTPAIGLDFGCGPAPALAHHMRSLGYQMQVYDLYYFPDQSVLEQKYDFVTSTEVIEHIAKPVPFIETLLKLVKRDGVVGLMTKLVIDQTRFQQWHYKNDPTHICFYSHDTFEFIAKRYKLSLEFIGNDVMLLRLKA